MGIFERGQRLLMRKPIVNFLHIGKNAGTQIRHFSRYYNSGKNPYHIVTHNHDVVLKRLPKREEYFFSIRDPANRFKSGFYSRQRKGMPKGYAEWSSHEAKAFSDFASANDLAESLFEDSEYGRKAIAAILSIRHTSMDQTHWFYNCGNFLHSDKPPFTIIRVEMFDSDFSDFHEKLGLHETYLPSEQKIVAHRNDYSKTPELSDIARANLRHWYRQDYQFLTYCEHWLVHERGRPPCDHYSSFT